MNRLRRQQLITELSGLPRDEFDAVVDEVRDRGNTEELGAAALQELFEAKRAPLAARLFAGSDEEN
jgi:hypothetical protein